MIIKNLNQLDKIIKKIQSRIENNSCIMLEGEIGVGKTTFTKKLINSFQTKEGVKRTAVLSPTYNLLYEYEIKKTKIKHYDLYRIEKLSELSDLGILNDEEECIKIIEWPKLVKNLFEDKLEINIYYEKKENHRRFEIKGHGKWKNIKLNEL